MGAVFVSFERKPTQEEILAAYDQVTQEDLRRLAERIFPFVGASLSAVGRVRPAAEYRAWLEQGI